MTCLLKVFYSRTCKELAWHLIDVCLQFLQADHQAAPQLDGDELMALACSEEQLASQQPPATSHRQPEADGLDDEELLRMALEKDHLPSNHTHSPNRAQQYPGTSSQAQLGYSQLDDAELLRLALSQGPPGPGNPPQPAMPNSSQAQTFTQLCDDELLQMALSQGPMAAQGPSQRPPAPGSSQTQQVMSQIDDDELLQMALSQGPMAAQGPSHRPPAPGSSQTQQVLSQIDDDELLQMALSQGPMAAQGPAQRPPAPGSSQAQQGISQIDDDELLQMALSQEAAQQGPSSVGCNQQPSPGTSSSQAQQGISQIDDAELLQMALSQDTAQQDPPAVESHQLYQQQHPGTSSQMQPGCSQIDDDELLQMAASQEPLAAGHPPEHHPRSSTSQAQQGLSQIDDDELLQMALSQDRPAAGSPQQSGAKHSHPSQRHQSASGSNHAAQPAEQTLRPLENGLPHASSNDSSHGKRPRLDGPAVSAQDDASARAAKTQRLAGTPGSQAFPAGVDHVIAGSECTQNDDGRQESEDNAEARHDGSGRPAHSPAHPDDHHDCNVPGHDSSHQEQHSRQHPLDTAMGRDADRALLADENSCPASHGHGDVGIAAAVSGICHAEEAWTSHGAMPEAESQTKAEQAASSMHKELDDEELYQLTCGPARDDLHVSQPDGQKGQAVKAAWPVADTEDINDDELLSLI